MRYAAGMLFVLVAALPYVVMLFQNPSHQELPGTSDETLAVLSPHRREVKLAYSRGFRAWMWENHQKRVDLRWLDVGGTSKAMKDLESRFATSPEAPGVDILFGGGVDPYLRAIERDWLQRIELPTSTVEAIPPTCAGFPVYDPDHYWFGVAMSGFGIIYNKPLLEQIGLPAPRTWQDLGKPAYMTWLGSGDPRSSGSVHMCYEIILQALGYPQGWHLITRLCANVRRFGESGGTVPREVAAAEVAAGMVIDQYARTVIDAVGGGRLLEFVLPPGVTVINPDAIGIIKGSERPALANRFVEYVLSADGQRLLFQPAGVNGQQHALHRLQIGRAHV